MPASAAAIHGPETHMTTCRQAALSCRRTVGYSQCGTDPSQFQNRSVRSVDWTIPPVDDDT